MGACASTVGIATAICFAGAASPSQTSDSVSQPRPSQLWVDATATTIGDTAGWTNKVEIADIDNDGRPDLLLANGGNYSDPGKPEPNLAFVNRGPGKPFERLRLSRGALVP